MTKTILLAVGAVVLVVLAAGTFLRGETAPANVTLASPSGAELVADDTALLVDIRTPEEWLQTGVVEGALLVTYTDADSFLKAIEPHLGEGQKIALICRSGNRTSRASQQIAARTDVPVVDIAGGMLRVMKEGYRPVRAQIARH